MTDYQGALERAVYQRLAAQVTLAVVYQHVPDNVAPPLVIIADINGENIGSKDAPLMRYDVTIAALVRGPARSPLTALQTQINEALHEWTPAASEAVLFGDFTVQSSSGRLLPDEDVIYYGESLFTVLVQDA